ncbi:hypothetical protein ACOME3_000845 [Neoechinorhynchus agilis]
MRSLGEIFQAMTPSFIANFELPETLSDIKDLSTHQWLELTVMMIGAGLVTYAAGYTISRLLQRRACCSKVTRRINETIDVQKDKVVHSQSIDDLTNRMEQNRSDKVVLCRCWKSKKFPYCDGSHAKWNKETGDNVGPIIVTK